MSRECANCERPLDESFQHCPRCGQKAALPRLSLQDVLRDVLHYFTNADKGFFQLLKLLLFNTGQVAKEYVAGKRKKYFTPLNFFLLVATISVVTINAVTSQAPTDVLKEHPEINHIPDPVHKQHVIRIYERLGEAMYVINNYSNIISMMAVPLIAFIYWLFYLSGKYNYTEHLVGCMYMVGFVNLFYAVIFVPLSSLLSTKHSNYSFVGVAMFTIIQAAYNAVFYYNFLDNRTKASFLKASRVSLFAVLFWFALSSFSVRLYVINGFWGLFN